MGAEAAVADADGVLGAEPGRDQRVGDGVDDERRNRQGDPPGTAEQAHAVDAGQAVAEPLRHDPVVGGDGVPSEMRRASMAAWRATAPSTLGEPASSRSGGSVQTTSSRSTRSTAPPPARNGSPSANVGRGPDEHAGAERRVHLVAAPRQEVGGGRQRAVRRELGGVDEHRDAPLVGGGDDRVERREPAR